MSVTILGFGIFCIVTAIVSGGCSAADWDFPVIKSLSRQILLAIFGILLICFAEWSHIAPLIVPVNLETIGSNSGTLDAGGQTSFLVAVDKSGPVEISFEELSPANARPSVVACPAHTRLPCPFHEISLGDSIRQQVAAGWVTVAVANGPNGPISYSLQVRIPSNVSRGFRVQRWLIGIAAALVLGILISLSWPKPARPADPDEQSKAASSGKPRERESPSSLLEDHDPGQG
jgi:hypothetical protein